MAQKSWLYDNGEFLIFNACITQENVKINFQFNHVCYKK